jgi:predicted nucleic acid-binding Zn ribbon protein
MRSKYSENQNQTTIKEALKAMIDYYRLKGGLNQTKIERLWEKAMGPSIAKHTTQIRLIKDKLFIDLNSASLKQELSFGKDKIKKILNEELGGEVVKKIFIK